MKTLVSLFAISLSSLGIATAQTTPDTYLAMNTTAKPLQIAALTIDSPVSVKPGVNGYTPTFTPTEVKKIKADGYKNFVFGVYAGLNTTKFKGEKLDANGSNSKLTGRLGYQLGFFVRGGGRLYGQIGAEYFASSSNYFTAGSGQSASNISDQINIKYIQVPVYIGYKLVESDRGISAVRLQLGVEYANQIGSNANKFGNLNDFKVKNGTFNGLGQLGFDMGPVFIDLTYHYGFSDAIQRNTGFAGSQRRILSASFGFKF